jgi:hypothetical protein
MAERVVPLNVPPIVASQRTPSRRARRPDHRQACANSTGQSLGTTKPKVSTQRRHVGRPRKRARSMGRRPPNCVRSSPISTHSGAGRRLLIRSCRGVALASSADGRRAWPEAGSVDTKAGRWSGCMRLGDVQRSRRSKPSCWKEKGSNARPSNTDACFTKLTQPKIKPNAPESPLN